jgi:hypothetical protein
MARQVSWETRLHEIRRSVANSVRSHYDRRDLELLFRLQPRSAGKLLESLPSVRVGRSDLVLREALGKFLEGAQEAEDVAGYCAEQRAQREVQSRRKPRSLVRRDFDPVSAASLSRWLSPGVLKIPYSSLDELFDVLWRVASAVRDDLEEFARIYEVDAPAKPEPEAAQEMRLMFEELGRMEQAQTFDLAAGAATKWTPQEAPSVLFSEDACLRCANESPPLRQKIARKPRKR